MPRAQHPDPDPELLQRTRQAAEEQTRALLETAGPESPIERVAWAAGIGAVDGVHDEVAGARAAGYTWGQIGMALGETADNVRIKFGGGYEAQRRYRERKRSEG